MNFTKKIYKGSPNLLYQISASGVLEWKLSLEERTTWNKCKKSKNQNSTELQNDNKIKERGTVHDK